MDVKKKAAEPENKFAAKIFSLRSYTPIPFVLLMLVFSQMTVQSFVIGLVLVLIGEAFRFGGVSWAGSETRTTGTVGGAFLVISGPFAYVRNPLYVGNILIYVGIGVMSLALFPWLHIVAFLWFVFQYQMIVSEEEKYLARTYGDAYQKYCNNVPRFFPRLSPYRNPKVEQPPKSNKAGLKSETRSLQAIVIVIILLIFRSIWLPKVYLP
ncbi:MAG: lipid A Kdo2 1-phosphate O-methyltransferase [Ignavibacteriaceae bacterium]|nr:MAG: isoprenylcysteine carboxylmethyltransferase family protein [Chlorobiota bacterium]GJQ31652.1 MAG: lipid A Kdo2 1-phosphate O-methyltransferase [Ignavibacteriaceae bacterium]